MKYKALALGFLLLLMPLIPLASILPTSAHNGPWIPELYVTPPTKVFTGPCLVSTNFAIDVNLWNDKSLTTVGVYAYDFNVTWNNSTCVCGLGESLITLVGINDHIPWPTGSYFVVKNETILNKGGVSTYHLAVTAVGSPLDNPALELGNTAFNASLVTLTFHIDNEPVWPYTYYTPFSLTCALSGDDPRTDAPMPLTDEQDSGSLTIYSSQPNIDPEATLAPINGTYPANVTVTGVNQTETVFIHLTNIGNAYSFSFVLKYDTCWKQTDVQHIKILPAFAPPYESLYESVDNASGLVYFCLSKPSEKPPVCGKDVPVVEIDFTSTLTPEIGKVPYKHIGAFSIVYASIGEKSNGQTYYYYFDSSPDSAYGAIIGAANRLVALQSPIDHGWNWIVTGLTAHDANPSDDNEYGIQADELIDAYLATGNPSYLDAAKSAADFMAYGNPTGGDFYKGIPPYPSLYSFGFATDYKFLMDLAAVTGNTKYSDYAEAAWTWQKANGGSGARQGMYRDGNQTAFWDFYADQWIGPDAYQAAAWSTSDWGLSTLQMGDTVWAQHMAAVIHANITNILAGPVNPNDFTVAGAAETLRFFETLGNSSYAADITALINKLITTAHTFSVPPSTTELAWLDQASRADVQQTAFAVMALWLAGTTERNNAAITAAMEGAAYLLIPQSLGGLHMTNGGWLGVNELNAAGYNEFSEYDAEALSALFTAAATSLKYSYDLPEIYIPKGYSAKTASADINLDGVVNILDLSAIAHVYGNSSCDVWVDATPTTPALHQYWSNFASPYDPNPVDIYDVVYIAKHFGDP